MTPAERLLVAADLLDKRAGEATEGPWTPHYGSDLHTDAAAWIGAPGQATKDGVFVATTANAVEGLGDAAYIATMHPEVGKALAAWLRSATANHREEGNDWTTSCTFCADEWMCADMTHAREIADLLLAGES